MERNNKDLSYNEWLLLLDQLEGKLERGEQLTQSQLTELNELQQLVKEVEDFFIMESKVLPKDSWEELRNRAEQNPNILRSRNVKIKNGNTDKSIIWFWSRLIVAACLLLFLSIYFYKETIKTESIKTVSNSYINSQNSKITLSLPNGETIELSDQKPGIVMDQESIKYHDGSFVLSDLNTSIKDETPSLVSIENLKVSTPPGVKYQVTLSDGTKVRLNSSSSLIYPLEFNKSERAVKLQGEAYFEVAHKENHDFIVYTPQQQVKVLGTEFNINAYEDEPYESTTLIRGKIKVSNASHSRVHENSKTISKSGQQTLIKGGEIELKTANIDHVLAWMKGRFIFDELNVYAIMRVLSRNYPIEVYYKSDFKNVKLGGSFSLNRPIEDILNALEVTGQVYFAIDEPKTELNKKKITIH